MIIEEGDLYVLSENNDPFDTDLFGPETDTHYSVLDFSKPKTPDYYFKRMNSVYTYQSPTAVLEIGDYTVYLPFKWTVAISYTDQVEIVEIKDIGGRDYESFCFNPISGFMPSRLKIRLIDAYQDTTWTAPYLEKNHMLVVPIGFERDNEGNRKKGPLCIVAGETKPRMPESIDMSLLW